MKKLIIIFSFVLVCAGSFVTYKYFKYYQKPSPEKLINIALKRTYPTDYRVQAIQAMKKWYSENPKVKETLVILLGGIRIDILRAANGGLIFEEPDILPFVTRVLYYNIARGYGVTDYWMLLGNFGFNPYIYYTPTKKFELYLEWIKEKYPQYYKEVPDYMIKAVKKFNQSVPEHDTIADDYVKKEPDLPIPPELITPLIRKWQL